MSLENGGSGYQRDQRHGDPEPCFAYECPHCDHMLEVPVNCENVTGICSHCGESITPSRVGVRAASLVSQGANPTVGQEDYTARATAASSSLPPATAAEQEKVLLRPREVVAGRFEIVDLLGMGGMGCVYRVHDRHTDSSKAMKVILPSLVNHPRAVERFRSEVRVAQRLTHPNIVRIFDLGEDSDRGLLFFTMELVEGDTLSEMLCVSGGRFHHRRAVGFIRSICEVLTYAHEHTVHRDLKPQNIMLTPEGGVKILDFGLAKLVSGGRVTQSSVALGTFYYQAPEQGVHLGHVDHRADIYSVGVMFYQMLTGELPMGLVKVPSEVEGAVPRGLDRIVMRCIAPDPEKRCASAQELLRMLKKMDERDALHERLPSPSTVLKIGALLVAVLAFLSLAPVTLTFRTDNARPASAPTTGAETTVSRAAVQEVRDAATEAQRQLTAAAAGIEGRALYQQGVEAMSEADACIEAGEHEQALAYLAEAQQAFKDAWLDAEHAGLLDESATQDEYGVDGTETNYAQEAVDARDRRVHSIVGPWFAALVLAVLLAAGLVAFMVRSS